MFLRAHRKRVHAINEQNFSYRHNPVKMTDITKANKQARSETGAPIKAWMKGGTSCR